MGDRLSKFLPSDRYDSFKPSTFSMILINEQGHIMGSSNQESTFSFFHSLIMSVPVLYKGKYTLIIDALWNEKADLKPEYKEVNLRIFTG